MMVTSILSFSHNVFYPIQDKFNHLSHIQIVVCNSYCFHFGLMHYFDVWLRIKEWLKHLAHFLELLYFIGIMNRSTVQFVKQTYKICEWSIALLLGCEKPAEWERWLWLHTTALCIEGRTLSGDWWSHQTWGHHKPQRQWKKVAISLCSKVGTACNTDMRYQIYFTSLVSMTKCLQYHIHFEKKREEKTPLKYEEIRRTFCLFCSCNFTKTCRKEKVPSNFSIWHCFQELQSKKKLLLVTVSCRTSMW